MFVPFSHYVKPPILDFHPLGYILADLTTNIFPTYILKIFYIFFKLKMKWKPIHLPSFYFYLLTDLFVRIMPLNPSLSQGFGLVTYILIWIFIYSCLILNLFYISDYLPQNLIIIIYMHYIIIVIIVLSIDNFTFIKRWLFYRKRFIENIVLLENGIMKVRFPHFG